MYIYVCVCVSMLIESYMCVCTSNIPPCTVMRPKNFLFSAVNARVRANDKINILNDFKALQNNTN